VNFRLKILPQIAMTSRSFSRNENQTEGTGWPSGNILDLPMYLMSPKIFEKVQKKLGEQIV